MTPAAAGPQANGDGVVQGPLKAVPAPQVTFSDAFWAPRQQTNLDVTVRYCFDKCEETNRIRNFAIAAGTSGLHRAQGERGRGSGR